MAEPHPFLVLSLPRSRSFWLSKLLSFEGRGCDHDPSRFWTNAFDAVRYFAFPLAGAADTGLICVWHSLRPLLPRDLAVVVVHRPVPEVVESLRRLGAPHSPRGLDEMARRLRDVDGLHVKAEQLDTYDTCAEVFRHCLGSTLPEDRWRTYSRLNLQCDRMDYELSIAANAAGIKSFYAAGTEHAP